MALSQLKPEDKAALAERVERHKVVYEVIPVPGATSGADRISGFELKLFGTHGDVPHAPYPGCGECTPVWEDLRQIVTGALPPPGRDSTCEVLPFLPSLAYNRARESRPDVELILRIRHSSGDFLAPADPCQHRCLKEIVEDLRALGAQENRWDEHVHRRFVAAQGAGDTGGQGRSQGQ